MFQVVRYHAISALVLIFASFFPAIAQPQSEKPDTQKYSLPTEHNPSSRHANDYKLVDDFLVQLIFNVGPSEHIPAPRAVLPTGTRLAPPANKKASRLESNRVTYSLLEDDNIFYLGYLKETLEKIPEQRPISDWDRDTQLAYWLNLHNITVIHTIAQNYPISDIEDLYTGGEKCVLFLGCREIKPLLNTTEIKIDNTVFTLSNLRTHILNNWNDPRVLYGLYMGYIGGPNIRISAYKGNEVWRQLEDNAKEFVNSIRGTRKWGGTLRVSEHYKLGKHLFPDFDNDIRAHFARYGKSKVQKWLAKNLQIKPIINNWGINDLYNGNPLRREIFIEFERNLSLKFQRQALDRSANVEIEEVN